MAAAQPNAALPTQKSLVARYSDITLAALLMLIVGMLIIPLPAWILDTLLVINISGAATVLLVALYTTEPLEFSVFPSLLLVMTLFRLALNVAATKLILGNGDVVTLAPKIIPKH